MLQRQIRLLHLINYINLDFWNLQVRLWWGKSLVIRFILMVRITVVFWLHVFGPSILEVLHDIGFLLNTWYLEIICSPGVFLFILCFWISQEIEGRVKLLVNFFETNKEEKIHNPLISTNFVVIERVVDVDFESIGFDDLVLISYSFIVNWVNIIS